MTAKKLKELVGQTIQRVEIDDFNDVIFIKTPEFVFILNSTEENQKPIFSVEKYKIYRPSNGTEGEGFIEVNCAKCVYGTNGCEFDIEAQTMCFQAEQAEYPVFWLKNEQGEPFCWKFLPNMEK